MAEKIKLVQGDTRPVLRVTITDDAGVAIPVSAATLKFREAGASTLKATITGVIIDGPNGVVDFTWTNTALDTAGEFEGEVEFTPSTGGTQTVYDLLKFKVREQFA
jgi:hypothetical protein